MGVAVLAATGCGFEPVSFMPESETPTPTASVDPARAVDVEYFKRARDGVAKTLPGGIRSALRISTPHLDCTLEERFVGDRIPQETAAQLDEATPLRAPDGYELAGFTLRGGTPSYMETADTNITAQLRVGDKYIPLPNLFDTYNRASGSYLKEWEMCVFCVLPGQRIELEITDEGRTVKVDLRDGVPILDDDWRATTGFRERQRIACTPENGVFRRGFETLAPEGWLSEGGSLAVGLQPDVLSGLMPWTPTLGWADDGEQWLAVPMNARIGVDAKVFPKMEIDVAASFEYQDETGTKRPAVHPPTVSTDALARNQMDLIVFWSVSGRDTAAQIVFNPVGRLAVDYTDYPNMPAEFSEAATPLEFQLTYSSE